MFTKMARTPWRERDRDTDSKEEEEGRKEGARGIKTEYNLI